MSAADKRLSLSWMGARLERTLEIKEHKDAALFCQMCLEIEGKVSVNHQRLHVELNLMIF